MIGEARNILFSWEAMQILEESIKNSGKKLHHDTWKILGADLGFWLLSNKQLETRSGGIKRPFCRISFVVKVVPIKNRLDNNGIF